jgi:hypothetical protein
MAYLDRARPLNVLCVASSDSAMTCVSYQANDSQTSYTVAVDDSTGRYILKSSASERVETGSESAHPAPTSTRPRPTVFLNGSKVSGIGPTYQTKSDSITLKGSVVPNDAALTISGLPETPTTARYGYRSIGVTKGRFTLTLPVGRGENGFQISQGSEVIVTFAVTIGA